VGVPFRLCPNIAPMPRATALAIGRAVSRRRCAAMQTPRRQLSRKHEGFATSDSLTPALTGSDLPARCPVLRGRGYRRTCVPASDNDDNYQLGQGWTAVIPGLPLSPASTSNLNNTGSPVASNLAFAAQDPNNTFGLKGAICFRTQRPTHLIVDVIGSVANASLHTPQRVLDTRG
jgi:hypothetical protein